MRSNTNNYIKSNWKRHIAAQWKIKMTSFKSYWNLYSAVSHALLCHFILLCGFCIINRWCFAIAIHIFFYHMQVAMLKWFHSLMFFVCSMRKDFSIVFRLFRQFLFFVSHSAIQRILNVWHGDSIINEREKRLLSIHLM